MKKGLHIFIIAALILAFVLSGCGGLTVEQVMSVIAPETTPIPGSDMEFKGEQVEEKSVLSLTYEEMDGIFSPFFAETDGDKTAVSLTQLSLQAVEGGRSPSVITRKTGENGGVNVTISLQQGLKCADGEPLTADDLLFTYYVLLDSDYNGPYAELKTLPIRGLSAYWNGMDGDMFGKYMMLYDTVYSGGKYDEPLQKALEEAKQAALDNGTDEAYLDTDADVQAAQKALDEYDNDRADEIRNAIEEAWKADVQDIVDYTVSNYAGTISLRTEYSKEEVQENIGLQVMYAMLDRGFGAIGEDGSFTSVSGKSWDLVSDYPTTADFYDELSAAYNGDVTQYWAIEGYARPDMLEAVQKRLVTKWAHEDENWRGEISSIAGLEKLDDHTVSFTMEVCDDAMLMLLTGIYAAPLHIYGDMALFDPANGGFGFTKDDLSAVREKNAVGIGAGEFVAAGTELFTATFTPNEHYWLGVSAADHAELTKK